MSVDERYVETVGEEKMDFEAFLAERGESGDKVEKEDFIVPLEFKEIRLQELVADVVYIGKPKLSKIEETHYPNRDIIKKYVPALLNELKWNYEKIEEILGHEKAYGFFNESKLCSEDTYVELCDKIGIDKLKCYKKYNELLDTNYRLNLYLVDEHSEEVYIIPINLYSNENMQKVGRNSGLFKLRMGLYGLDYPNVSLQYKDFDVNIDFLRKDVNGMDEMALRIDWIEKKDFQNGGYNTFVVVNPKNNQ